MLENVIGDKLPRPEGSDGLEMLQWLVQKNLIFYVKWIMVSVSVAYLSVYGFLYITASGKEENITEQHDNLIWALIGFTLVGVSSLAIDVFAPVAGNKTKT